MRLRGLAALAVSAGLALGACGDSDEPADAFTDPTVDPVAGAAGGGDASTTAAPTTTSPTTAAPADPTTTTTAPPSTVAPTTDVSATTAPPPALATLPPILLTDGTEVSLLRAGESVEPLLSLDTPARIAHAVDETFVVVEEVEAPDARRVVAHAPDATIDLELGTNPRLHDVQLIDGLFQVLATDDVSGALDDRDGDLVLVDGAGGRTFLRTAIDIEFFTVQASVAPVAGLASIAAYADLTEIVQVFPIDDATLPLPGSPTDGLAYNAPPLIIYADLAEDGSTLAHAEGPDFDGISGEAVRAPWTVALTEVGSGAELFRAEVIPAGADEQITWIDFDGRWLLVSVGRFAPDEGEADVELAPGRALIFDVTNPVAGPATLPVDGTATLLAAG